MPISSEIKRHTYISIPLNDSISSILLLHTMQALVNDSLQYTIFVRLYSPYLAPFTSQLLLIDSPSMHRYVHLDN